MATVKTYLKCPKCNGVGSYETSDINHQPVSVNPCEGCGGTGYYEVGSIDITEITTLLNKISSDGDVLKESMLSSSPPVGKLKVTNIYINPETGKAVLEYDDGGS